MAVELIVHSPPRWWRAIGRSLETARVLEPYQGEIERCEVVVSESPDAGLELGSIEVRVDVRAATGQVLFHRGWLIHGTDDLARTLRDAFDRSVARIEELHAAGSAPERADPPVQGVEEGPTELWFG